VTIDKVLVDNHSHLALIIIIINGSIALLVGLGRSFSFLILYIAGRTPWTGEYLVVRINTHTHIPMPRLGFEPTTPAFERAKPVHASQHGNCDRLNGHFQLGIASDYNVTQISISRTSLLSLLQSPLIVAWLQTSNKCYSSRSYGSKAALPNRWNHNVPFLTWSPSQGPGPLVDCCVILLFLGQLHVVCIPAIITVRSSGDISAWGLSSSDSWRQNLQVILLHGRYS
jgi:hypothetical protein